jgi:peptidoglycan hydrolase-like protein with peptidoglycan-binding domain
MLNINLNKFRNKKSFIYIILFSMTLPIISLSEDTLSFVEDSILNLPGLSENIYIKSGSKVDSLKISDSILEVVIPSGSNFALKTLSQDILNIIPSNGSIILIIDGRDIRNGFINKLSIRTEFPSVLVNISLRVPSANSSYNIDINGNLYSNFVSDYSKMINFTYRPNFQDRPIVVTASGPGLENYSTSFVPGTPSDNCDKPKIEISQTSKLLAQQSIPYYFKFKRNLKKGTRSIDVKYLQIILNSDPDTIVAKNGPGSRGKETTFFGPLTQKAVIKFQEKYYCDVLFPSGFKKGTGFVGPYTRQQLNRFLER